MTDKRSTYAGWIEAFQIFAKYSDYDAIIDIAAEHDVIYTGPHPDAVTAEDAAKLEALGWRMNEEYECFERYT